MKSLSIRSQVNQADSFASSGASGENHSSAQDSGLHGRLGGQLAVRTFGRETPEAYGTDVFFGAHQRMCLVRDSVVS